MIKFMDHQAVLIEIEPTRGCNLKCRMCHVAFMREAPQFLNLDRISDFTFLKGKTVILGAVFEPFLHPEINRLIDILNKHRCKLVIITNARNLHKKKIPAIFDSNLEAITFSFDGITESTYEEIRVGGNFNQTLENIGNFRSAFSNKDTFFAINYTVLLNNMNEVPLAPSFWESYNIDLLRFISMVIRNESEFLEKNSLWTKREIFFQALNDAAKLIDESNYKISIMSPYFESQQAKKDWGDRIQGGVFHSRGASNAQRIYHREFEYGASDGMTFPCRSPFVATRITWDGLVNLCHNRPVGDLYQNTFEEIWNGHQAQELRNQVKNNNDICDNCDYFRFCINSHYIDLNDVNNYYDKNMRTSKSK